MLKDREDISCNVVSDNSESWYFEAWSMKIKILQRKIVMRVYMELTEIILIELQGKKVEQAVVTTTIMEW